MSGAARLFDPDTSHRAAASIGDGLEPLIVCALAQYGPMTDSELVDKIPAYGPSIKSARSRLKRDGFVEATGERRRTPRGRLADVYGLAE